MKQFQSKIDIAPNMQQFQSHQVITRNVQMVQHFNHESFGDPFQKIEPEMMMNNHLIDPNKMQNVVMVTKTSESKNGVVVNTEEIKFQGQVLKKEDFPEIHEHIKLGKAIDGSTINKIIQNKVQKEIRLVPISKKEEEQIQKEEEEQKEIEEKFKAICVYDEQLLDETEEGICQSIYTFVSDAALLISAFTVDVIAYCTIVYPSIVILTIFQLSKLLFCGCNIGDGYKEKVSFFMKLFIYIFMLLGSLATIYLQVMSFYYLHKDSIEKFWFLDALIFFFSTVLVCSYIKNVQKRITHICDLFSVDHYLGQKTINTLFISTSGGESAYVFDCVSDNNNKIILDEYEAAMKSYQSYELTQKFNLFEQKVNPIQFQYKGIQIVMGSNITLHSKFSQYISLIIIIALKTITSLTYIFLTEVDFNVELSTSIIATTMFYINMTWCLNKVLSNYDLRRKVMMMKKVNSLIDFQESEKDISSDLIDITCSVSLEAWDNTRKFVYDYTVSKLKKLELVYVCLFFYYVFVTVICVIAYGEFYSIIPKESLYLQPLMVIQNSCDFIFLNVILIWRIYEGQNFNDTFDDSEEKIDYLIGMVEDLIQLFDFFFLPERQESKVGQQVQDTYSMIDQSLEVKSETKQTTQQQKEEEDRKQANLSKIKASTVYGKAIMRIKSQSLFSWYNIRLKKQKIALKVNSGEHAKQLQKNKELNLA